MGHLNSSGAGMSFFNQKLQIPSLVHSGKQSLIWYEMTCPGTLIPSKYTLFWVLGFVVMVLLYSFWPERLNWNQKASLPGKAAFWGSFEHGLAFRNGSYVSFNNFSSLHVNFPFSPSNVYFHSVLSLCKLLQESQSMKKIPLLKISHIRMENSRFGKHSHDLQDI